MSGSSGGGWIDKLVSACVSIMLASIALSCAVALIRPILPTLITIVGVLTIIGLLIGTAIVVIRTWRNRW